MVLVDDSASTSEQFHTKEAAVALAAAPAPLPAKNVNAAISTFTTISLYLRDLLFDK